MNKIDLNYPWCTSNKCNKTMSQHTINYCGCEEVDIPVDRIYSEKMRCHIYFPGGMDPEQVKELQNLCEKHYDIFLEEEKAKVEARQIIKVPEFLMLYQESNSFEPKVEICLPCNPSK